MWTYAYINHISNIVANTGLGCTLKYCNATVITNQKIKTEELARGKQA